MKFTRLFLLAAILMSGACSSNVYKDRSFISRNNLNGKTLAILPAEISFSGNLPKSWNAGHIAKMENEQSLLLQQEIHDNLLLHASRRQLTNKYQVSLIDNKTVNDRIYKLGLSTKDTWAMTSEELAERIGADMVIRTKMHNVRYMSEAAATGINIGTSVLGGIMNRNSGTTIGIPHARSGETDISVSLYHTSRPAAIAHLSAGRNIRVKKLPVYVRN